MTSSPNEIQTVVDVAQEATLGQDLGDGLYAFRLCGAINVVDVRDHRPVLNRKEGEAVVYDAPSFIAYFAKHRTDATDVWADVEDRMVTAVFDADDTAAPGWGRHRLILMLRHADPWLAWTAYDRKLRPQTEFAEHVEDRLPDFVDPDGATMLELAQSFHARSKSSFESSQRLSSGETQLAYREEVDASAGKKGQITIPNTFEVALQPFLGSDVYKVHARLRYRLDGGRLQLGYFLDRPGDVLASAFTDVVTAVEQGTEMPVLRGHAPSPR